MARKKSPYGPVRRLVLRFRRGDPRFAELVAVLDTLPEGEGNRVMLECLLLGIRDFAAGMSRSEHRQDPPVEPRSKVPEPAPIKTPQVVFSEGARLLFTQF